MKLCSFILNGRASFGAVENGGVIDLAKRTGAASLREFLTQGPTSRAKEFLGDPPDHSLSAIEFAPVIPDPDKIICVGLNYHAHIEETGRE